MVKRPTAIADDDNGNERRGRRGLDPLISALLSHMPAAHTVWSPPERQKWMSMLNDALAVIYKDAPDPKPERTSGAPQHPPGTVSPPQRG